MSLRVTNIITPEKLYELYVRKTEDKTELTEIGEAVTDAYGTTGIKIMLETALGTSTLNGMIAMLCIIEEHLREQEKEAQNAASA